MMHARGAAQWVRVSIIVVMALALPLSSNLVLAGEPGQGLLRVHQQYFPQSLDPQQSSGVEFATFLGANYEGLTRLDANLEIVPAAAESWEFNGDLSAIVFHLRSGLTYSDGSPLTAERFAEAIRRACDPHVHGDYQHLLFDVAGCEAFATLSQEGASGTPAAGDLVAYDAARRDVGVRVIDDCTLEIRLTHVAPSFPAIAGMPLFYPVKQELIAQGGDEWWRDPALQIGNGPFQVVRIDSAQSILLEANARYWGGRPRLDRLELVYIPDSAEALAAYRAGDLDIVSLDAGLLPEVAQDGQLSQDLLRLPMAATSFLSFNLTREPFTDKQVREAFAYGFDRETYCARVRGGVCAPATSWIPPDLPGAITTGAYAFDPERARQALAASSYGGPEQLPPLALVYWGEDATNVDANAWIVEQYRDILGVEITLQPMDGDAMVAAMSEPETYPALSVTGWIQDYPDPQNWLSVYWTCAASFAQDFGYCNPEFDALIDSADREIDGEKRLALYERAGMVLVDDVPGVFLTHGVFLFLVKPAVTGYAATPGDAGWPGQTASLLTVTVDH